MILSLLLPFLFNNPAVQLQKQYECFQHAETTWRPRYPVEAYDGIWETDRKSKVMGVDADALIFLNDDNKVQGMAFVYIEADEQRMSKLTSKLLKAGYKENGLAIYSDESQSLWVTSDSNVMYLQREDKETIVLAKSCTAGL